MPYRITITIKNIKIYNFFAVLSIAHTFTSKLVLLKVLTYYINTALKVCWIREPTGIKINN